MKVLVTGSTGFVGSHASRAALAAGHDLRLLVRDAARARAFLSDLVEDAADRCDFVERDVTDRAAVDAAIDGCDAVVHAAAMVALHRSQAAEAHRVNTTATANVLGAAVAAGCDPIIHVSSVSVLETTPPVTTVDAPLRQGGGGYSRSKVDSEWMCRGLQAAGHPIVTIYPSGVAGPDAPAVTPVHSVFVSCARSMPEMASGISLIDVRDLAAMITACLVPDRGPQRVLAAGRFHPWKRLLDDIDRLRGEKMFRYKVPGSALRGVGRFVDLTKISIPVDFELNHEAMVEATRACPYDSSAGEAYTGVTPRPMDETIIDTYRWLAEFGALRRDEIGAISE